MNRDDVRKEVIQELVDYIDGDVENGPRYGVDVSEEEIEEEVTRRMNEEAVDERPWGEQQREIDWMESRFDGPEPYEPSPYDGTYSEE